MFIFESSANIHDCLGLASVNGVAGKWGNPPVMLTSPQQGRKDFISHVYCNIIMLVAGATPAQSKANLAQWLDVTIQGMTKYDTLVYAGANREWGFFHHILLDEFIC